MTSKLVDRGACVCVNTRVIVTLSAEKLPRTTGSLQFNLTDDSANPSIFAIVRQKGIVPTLERNVKRRACFREEIPSSRSQWKNICFLRLTTMRVGCNRRFLTYIHEGGYGDKCANILTIYVCVRGWFSDLSVHGTHCGNIWPDCNILHILVPRARHRLRVYKWKNNVINLKGHTPRRLNFLQLNRFNVNYTFIRHSKFLYNFVRDLTLSKNIFYILWCIHWKKEFYNFATKC